MSYIGVQPTAGQYRKLDDISGSFNGSTTTFTTQVGSQNVSAGTAQQLLVSLGGVIQNPITDYTVSTNSITFTTAPAAGLSFFAVLMGEAVNTGTPSDGVVTGAKLSAPFNYNSGLLYLDSSNNRVGIGNTAPSGSLHLGNGTGSADIILDKSEAGAGTLRFWKGGSASAYIQYDASEDLVYFSPSGAGNHIFYTGGNEAARIDSSRRLLVGTSSARTNFFNGTAGARLEIENAGAGVAEASFVRDENNTNGGIIILGKSRGTTAGSNTIIQSGDEIGVVDFQAADGTDFVIGARIAAIVDGTPGADDMPGRLVFSVTRDGASSPTEAMRINSTGTVDVYTPASGNYAMRVLPSGGADRAILLAGIGGVTNGFRADWINAASLMAYRFNDIATTSSGANAHLDSGDSNRLYRSTSSLRYKKDIEDIEQDRADAVLSLRPVWYRSKSSVDPSDWSWYGLIAEEVAEVEPRLVHWTYLEEDYDVEEVNGQLNKTPKEGAQKVPDGVQYDRLAVLLLDVVKRQQQTIEALEARVTALESA